MCGIFGVTVASGSSFPPGSLRPLMDRLFVLSESRGKEAAGIAVRSGAAIALHKEPHAASVMIRSPQYRSLFTGLRTNGNGNAPAALIGHSRLVTNGHQLRPDNNQPVQRDGMIAVHNGIIVNHERLWAELGTERHSEVDSEVILGLLRHETSGAESIIDATRKAFTRLEGAASIALMFEHEPTVLLATNTGSLWLHKPTDEGVLVFASERYILEQLLRTRGLRPLLGEPDRIRQIHAGQALTIDLTTGETTEFEVSHSNGTGQGRTIRLNRDVTPSTTPVAPPESLRRCTRCVLPETMPFIEFDDEGVCNYCHNYQPMKILGRDRLEEEIAPFRSKKGEPDCIVAFSGGRDSSYGLHLIKTELGLNPIAMTYDWGMVTDLARRNQARVCGKLGIEHILISADIDRKRRYIHKNVAAWLRKPDLAMIPVFTAGDKFYFSYIDEVRRQTGVEMGLFCVNPMEQTHFKVGFSGISGDAHSHTASFLKRIRLASTYGMHYLRNPAYINASLFDSALSFVATYFRHHDFLMLFDYLRWEEDEVAETLVREYDWEIAPDTKTTWRIGDGTASFYNYIYYTVAGFTEHDTFRSNQVREGDITRDQALALVAEDNQPRLETMREYCELIDIDFDSARAVIDAIPKLY